MIHSVLINTSNGKMRIDATIEQLQGSHLRYVVGTKDVREHLDLRYFGHWCEVLRINAIDAVELYKDYRPKD